MKKRKEEKKNPLWSCHNSRKKDRVNEDGTFLPHQKDQRLVFTQGRESRQVGEVDKENNSPVSRSEEDVLRNHGQFSIEPLVKEDHKGKRIGKAWSLKRTTNSGGAVHHRWRTPPPNLRSHTTHMWNTLRNTHVDIPPMLASPPRGARSSRLLYLECHLHRWGTESSHNLDGAGRRVPRNIYLTYVRSKHLRIHLWSKKYNVLWQHQNVSDNNSSSWNWVKMSDFYASNRRGSNVSRGKSLFSAELKKKTKS